MKVLTFTLDGSRYGILTDAVSEIVNSVSLVNLPGSPADIEGVFSLRGQTVPVVSVRSRFGLKPGPLAVSDHFIIVYLHDNLVGLHVDHAEDIIDIDNAEITALEDTVAETGGVAGVVSTVVEGMLVIYDIDAFLTKSEAETLVNVIRANDTQPTM